MAPPAEPASDSHTSQTLLNGPGKMVEGGSSSAGRDWILAEQTDDRCYPYFPTHLTPFLPLYLCHPNSGSKDTHRRSCGLPGGTYKVLLLTF